MNNSAGYSGKPLIAKLGYKPGETVYLVNSSQQFRKYLVQENITSVDNLPTDWLHGFFRSKGEFATFLQNLNLDKIKKGLWLCWPKKSSGLQTGLTEQTFRNSILPLSWVDVKVAAIDETWSGLKFLKRKIKN